MDLYSAARRLGRPFRVGREGEREGDDLGIAAHGIIGDGFTAALVRVDGAIDWLCLPRFDSPSVFGALLDRDRGGVTSVTPVQRPFDSLQRYDPNTNVLETLFQVPGQGVVRLVDYMPWSDDPRATIHEVHRRIDCHEGAVDLEVRFDPRFDFGASPADLQIREHGLIARGPGGERLVAALQGEPTWAPHPKGGLAARMRLTAGQRRWMVLSWDAEEPEPVRAYRPFEHLRSTRHHWRQWSLRLDYDGPWRHHVLRSALCLKLLIYAPTGAMVAAPTTSLPEWIGGTRNWDYRFTWARDAAFAIRAANLLGYTREAREFFHYLRDTIDGDAGLQVMYAVDGRPVPEERELDLAGFGGSRPVRIGNAARDQLQLDTAGAVVDAAHLHEHFGGTLSLRTWRKLRRIIEHTCSMWRKPDHGIWEPRSGVRHNVHSKAMCWLALDRGAGIAAQFGAESLRRTWAAAAAEIRAEICHRGLDPTGKHFVAAYGEDRTDGALLMLPMLQLLPDDHPALVRTVEQVRAELADGPFVYRYRGEDDGVGGAEGAFILCGFWLAEALALQGRIEEAQEVFLAHSESANHLGLLAEEIDPRSRAQLGNFPQAFSHLGLINAAFRIDLALRLRDEGLRGGPHFIRGARRPG